MTLENMANTLSKKKTKDILKEFNQFLSDHKNTFINENPALHELIQALMTTTDALKDTYAPNILRFMTSKDKYIQSLVASAKNIMDDVIPDAIECANKVVIKESEQKFVTSLLMYLTIFAQSNRDKQATIDASRGDMIENTTHDIMQKYLHKNFNDIAALFEPIINALKK